MQQPYQATYWLYTDTDLANRRCSSRIGQVTFWLYSRIKLPSQFIQTGPGLIDWTLYCRIRDAATELLTNWRCNSRIKLPTDFIQMLNWWIGNAAAESGRWLTDFIQKPNWKIDDAAAESGRWLYAYWLYAGDDHTHFVVSRILLFAVVNVLSSYDYRNHVTWYWFHRK